MALGAATTVVGRALATVALLTAGRYMLTLLPVIPGAPGLLVCDTWYIVTF